VSTSDSSSEEITRPGFYRAALWSVRLAYVCMAFWMADLVFIRSNAYLTLSWFVALAFALIGLALLRLAGARFTARRGSVYVSGETGRNFYRDVFWLPRR
jgi:hypothetical protein